MRISRIDAVCKDISLRTPFKFASCELTYLPYAWVRVETDGGLVGYGECPTYWDPSGETQLAAVGALRHITPAIVGTPAYDLERVFQTFDRIAYGAFAAKCGLDMALHDILGKWLNVPIYVLLGGGSSVVRVNANLPLNASLDLEDRLDQLVSDGYTTFKIKVGADLEKELDLVHAVSRMLPDSARVFLDANQAWGDAKTAIRAIRRFQDLGVVWIEQPIRADDIEGLRTIRQSVDMSIIADESLYSPRDAVRLVRTEAVDMFNVKLAKCGGLYLGKKLFAIAQASNIGCILGSMIESSLGMLANYHFAKAHPMITCDLSVYSYVDEDVDVAFRFSQGEMQMEDETPGLGYKDDAPLQEAFKSELSR